MPSLLVGNRTPRHQFQRRGVPCGLPSPQQPNFGEREGGHKTLPYVVAVTIRVAASEVGLNLRMNLTNAFGDELGDVFDLERAAGGVAPAAEVHDAALVVGDDGFGAGGLGVVELALH